MDERESSIVDRIENKTNNKMVDTQIWVCRITRYTDETQKYLYLCMTYVRISLHEERYVQTFNIILRYDLFTSLTPTKL